MMEKEGKWLIIVGYEFNGSELISRSFKKYDPVDYNNDTRFEMLTADFDNDTLRGIDAVPLEFESTLSAEV